MSDVALTVPVIKGVAEQHPGVKITMVTRQAFAPFFNTLPEVRLFHPEFGSRHKGLSGMRRIYRDLKEIGNFDAVIDLHDRDTHQSSIVAFQSFRRTRLQDSQRPCREESPYHRQIQKKTKTYGREVPRCFSRCRIAGDPRHRRLFHATRQHPDKVLRLLFVRRTRTEHRRRALR